MPDRMGVITNIDGHRNILFIQSEGVLFWSHKHLVAEGVAASNFFNLREGHVVKIEPVDDGPRGQPRCRILGLAP